jgi:hypothetical protein
VCVKTRQRDKTDWGTGRFQSCTKRKIIPRISNASTDTNKGFPVVINAFISGSTASNKTIDRVYTGFVKLLKETRILQGSGPTVAPGDVAFSQANKNPAAVSIRRSSKSGTRFQ